VGIVRKPFLRLSTLKSIGNVPSQKNVQVCVIGKVFKPSRLKVLALNMALNEGFKLVEWYLSFNSKRVSFTRTAMKKELFNTALIQTVRGL
jgi:hypothetical protein